VSLCLGGYSGDGWGRKAFTTETQRHGENLQLLIFDRLLLRGHPRGSLCLCASVVIPGTVGAEGVYHRDTEARRKPAASNF